MIPMTSLTAHRYSGVELQKGDPFEAHPRNVSGLRMLGRAEPVGDNPVAVVSNIPTQMVKVKRGRGRPRKVATVENIRA